MSRRYIDSMYTAKTVDSYVNNHPHWQAELKSLRAYLNETELVECVKWGAPCYTLNGENIVGLMGFKNYAGMWFHQGVFLKDRAKVLVNAQEGKTKALRQWRFTSADELNPDLIRSYIQEAIENAKAGRKMTPTKAKEIDTPTELIDALENDADASEKFQGLKPGQQREFATYIADAKQQATKIRRLDKIIPMIKSGIGLNDKYR